ncbi:DEAD/DEAH box helicase [Vibrio sp. TMPB1044]|uniref:DEAD/DEAH box helicase n=1 Tax=Vibrio sp. TMPB1044 TaxID=3051822 RepID=UPI00255BEE43|nr:DEAD/DEAH box helicase [Vibrio sp. TMPB1044]MDL5027827.1 DEAD/DEAH box helicase [Vibrio sp. TMPB1044]MDN5207955.1 DEAD/DEAH box helicase [Vibrio sp. TMPB1044]
MASSFSWLKDVGIFSESMRKMSLNIDLSSEELEFVLSCAILFFNEYAGDNRKSPYFQLAYYITLKCAINNNNYEPLLDASANFGLYPISKYILNNILSEEQNFNKFSLDYQLDKFKHGNVFETYEQRQSREEIVSSYEQENCYVAPTSFGKSSLIVEIINKEKISKVAIIVPTKSLLIQTYKLMKSNFPFENIIFHDEMYDGSDSFISIFTQERALRLLKDKNMSFDILIVDEAHNLFEMDGRSLLLTRLIRRNRQRNPKSRNYYLSPLISEIGNLKVSNKQDIFERRIINNIKEADISEYKNNGEIHKYNRFLNQFYRSGSSNSFIDYIIENKKEKNFIYLRAPKKVEQLAVYLDSKLETINSEELLDLSDVISKNVHNDFYCVDYVKKGLVYLHGKLPDLIKEYLEYKFTHTKEINYIVANSVILEGVNLPVDNLFILNTYNLDAKSLTNLIGRVNRLNEVFDKENKSLRKLLPSVHFVNSIEFNGKKGNMVNKIQLLKSGFFKDVVKNPLLLNFSFDNIKNELHRAQNKSDIHNVNKIESKIKTMEEIIEREDFLVFNEDDESSKVRRVLMESALSSAYYDSDSIFEKLENRINEIVKNKNWLETSVIDKIYLFFIDGFESYISNAEFSRLKHPKARSFYKMFTENLHRLTLKEHISDTVKYFYSIRRSKTGKEFFIGSSYGEIPKSSEYDSYGNNVYIDLSQKSHKELVNIALVKIKIESDFVSYTLNEYVNILFELDLINEKEYELHIYGTTKKSNSEFIKIGLSGSLINKLDRDNQIVNLTINEFGIIEHNQKFRDYLVKQDDLIQFEVSKYIDI